MTFNCEGAVARVTTFLLAVVFSVLPVKVNVGDTWKIEFLYIVSVDIILVEV